MRDIFILVILTFIVLLVLLFPLYFFVIETRHSLEENCYAEIPTISVTDNNGVTHDNGYIRIKVACSDMRY